MRAKDREEILASGGWTRPEACIRANINRSAEAWAAYAGTDLLCVFGVVPTSNQGVAYQVPWLFGSPAIERHALTFWRCSKRVVEHWRGKYPLLLQMVHGQYTEALHWIERLGFKLEPPQKWGKRGDLFCAASLKTEEVILHV